MSDAKLDFLAGKTRHHGLQTLDPLHGYGIVCRVEQLSGNPHLAETALHAMGAESRCSKIAIHEIPLVPERPPALWGKAACNRELV
jgi:hypothetical protein